MIKFLFVAIVVFAVLCFVLFEAWKAERKRAKENWNLYDITKKRNLELSSEIGRLQAKELIYEEERKDADEKIKDVHVGTNRERFDAVNRGLRNNRSPNRDSVRD